MTQLRSPSSRDTYNNTTPTKFDTTKRTKNGIRTPRGAVGYGGNNSTISGLSPNCAQHLSYSNNSNSSKLINILHVYRCLSRKYLFVILLVVPVVIWTTSTTQWNIRHRSVTSPFYRYSGTLQQDAQLIETDASFSSDPQPSLSIQKRNGLQYQANSYQQRIQRQEATTTISDGQDDDDTHNNVNSARIKRSEVTEFNTIDVVKQQQYRDFVAKSLANEQVSTTVDTDIDDEQILHIVEPSNYPIVPIKHYKPQSTSQLQAIFVGVTRGNNVTSLLLEGLKISRYIRTLASFILHSYTRFPDDDEMKPQDIQEPYHGEEQDDDTENDFYHVEYVEENIWYQEAHNETPVVIVVDWSSMNRDCYTLRKLLAHVEGRYSTISNTSQNQEEQEQQQIFHRIILVDESSSARIDDKCSNIPLLDTAKVTLVKRSLVINRYWSNSHLWVQPGRIQSDVKDHGYAIRRLPITLSQSWITDIHKATEEIFGTYNDNIGSNEYTDSVVQSKKRETDICVLYNGLSSHYSLLRKKVMAVVEPSMFIDENNNVELEILHLSVHPDNVTTYDLLQGMLGSKIVILAQSDEWEGDDDMYYQTGSRLLQAMSSGALVLTDNMIAKPTGFLNKTHLLYYDSVYSLKALLHKYLFDSDKREVIAHNGLQLVLGRHRTYHAIETLLFGKPLTQTDRHWMGIFW